MKFITNTFSLNMLLNTNVCLVSKELTEEQFKESCSGAENCIGDSEIAAALNLPYKPEAVKARPGDEILTAYFRAGNINFTRLKIMEVE